MTQKNNVRLVDTETGELLSQGVFVYVTGKVKWKEGFFMGFQSAFEKLAQDADLTGQPMRVLLFLFSRLNFENYVAVPQTEVSEMLDMRKERVSEAVRKLVEKGVLLKGPKLGRMQSYQLNSHYGWKGSIRNLEQARRDHLRLAVSNSEAERDSLTRDMFEPS
jgi:DNA-binding MarR family transcriptional regulator